MAILGYEPRRLYAGRGAFESMGAGLAMAPGDIAFKCNFATLDTATGLVLRRRADRDFEAAGPALSAALDGLAIPGFPRHALAVRYATEHRCGVVLRGPGLSDAVGGTDPLRDGLPLRVAEPLDGSPEAGATAAVVEAASAAMRAALEAHPVNAARAAAGRAPANVVLLRGCGRRLALAPFAAAHGFRAAAAVAPTKIIAGLALTAGFALLDAPGATGDCHSALDAKARAAAAALLDSGPGGADFVFLHVKAVDDAGHDGRPALKVAALEAVDAMIGQALRLLWAREGGGGAEAAAEGGGGGDVHGARNGAAAGAPSSSAHDAPPPAPPPPPRFSIVVTGDHSTPVEFGDHSHEPVPVALAHVRHVARGGAGGPAALARAPLRAIPPPEAAVAAAGGDAAALARLGAEAHSAGGVPPAPAPAAGDGVAAFSERAAAAGALGRFPGSELMALVREFVGR
jgi:2,3-diphosphopglycerate-independent phosphoglycerate mutase